MIFVCDAHQTRLITIPDELQISSSLKFQYSTTLRKPEIYMTLRRINEGSCLFYKSRQCKRILGRLYYMDILRHTHLNQFLKRPTLIKAKQAFVAYSEEGLPVPEEIVDFLLKAFRGEIKRTPRNLVAADTSIDRSILVELMIRIAKSQDDESIDSICQMVAEESGIQGNEANTAGELLRKSMEEFRGRSKVKRSQ